MDATKLWKEGNYIMSTHYSGYKIDLYQVGSEYYELYSDRVFNCILKIRRAGEADLVKYLNRIELRTLVNEKGQ